ncbi:acylphosphatase [Deltaproteobacteria bacterium TL4]
MALKHLHISVFGIVQGVSFRYYTTLKACELGVKGFVRNEHNGAVYIEAEADEETLEVFVQWCHHGPPLASVKRVEVTESPIFKNFPEFRTAY